jgi:hypothetical protein
MRSRALICGASALLAAPATMATAQVLQFDVNSISYTVLDGSGTPGAFGGEAHTGAVELSLGAGRLPAVHIQENPPFGPFEFQAGFTGALSGLDVRFDLDNGDVTGGHLRLELDTGVFYEADVDAIGSVDALLSGGFTIDYSTSSGSFSDADFAGVDVTRWFDFNGQLPGSGLFFRFNPESPTGTADTDIFVAVPAPASLALLAAAGIVATRRRR